MAVLKGRPGLWRNLIGKNFRPICGCPSESLTNVRVKERSNGPERRSRLSQKSRHHLYRHYRYTIDDPCGPALGPARPQNAELQQKLAAAKHAAAENKQRLLQYQTATQG